MISASMRCVLTALGLWGWLAAAPAGELRGHGGPVRAIVLSADGALAATAGFDSTVILWSLPRGDARQVLRFHQGAVNALALLGDGRLASAGEDGRIALWRGGAAQPATVLEGHGAPVVALAVSPDGARLLSASWDGTARVWPLSGGAALVLAEHRANVNGAAFLADGRIVTGAYDGTLRLFGPAGDFIRQWALDAPVSALSVAGDDEIIAASADGIVRFVDAARGVVDQVMVAEAPLVALAVSRDGRQVAAAGFRGALALIDRAGRRLERRLEGPAFPLWSLAFSPDGGEILTGGADRLVRRWSVATGEPSQPVVAAGGEDVPAQLKDHPGALVFRACAACHTLRPDGGNRAGPSLHGLFGRKIGTAPGYDYSPAVKTLPIVWTRETVDQLFALGPAAYTPGSKMPEQIVGRVEDRAALIDFLERAQGR